MSRQKGSSVGISRRDFARRAAFAAATAACLPGDLLAVPRPLRAGDERELGVSPETQAEVDAKVQAILRKYGDRLTEAQKTDLRRVVLEGQKPLERLRAFALDNADQPANVMKIYPDAGAIRRAPSR